MTHSVNLSDNHVFLTSEKDMQDIYLGKLGPYGVSYFEYLRVYDDGRSAMLASNQDVVRYVFDNEIPVAAPVAQEYIQNDFHYFILPVGSYIKPIHDIKNYFNLSHFVNLVERHPGYIDLYCFGGDSNNTDIMNFYLNKMDVLENFKIYFQDKASDLVKKALKSKIVLSRNMLPPYKGLAENSSNLRNIYKLTDRQTGCLHYLLKGMTIKQIATTLKLSAKTVEHYIETVKVKLNCHSRAELIIKALNLPGIKERL